jgi:translation initiation factor IF-2
MNVDKLLEAIITIGEMNEYSANPNRLAMGVVIESSVDKGLGSVATVLVKNGTLNKGDFAIVGSATGHIRIMFDENLKEVKSAGPSQPVKVVGLNRTPSAGQHFIVSNNEDEIKELAKKIGQYESDENFGMIHMSANDSPDLKKINMILKTDVHGSLEAIKGMLSKIVIEGSKLYLIRSTVGGINEADINLAKSSNSIIVGFNIKPSRAVKDIADKQGVKILFYNIIYKLSDDVTAMLLGKLDPIMVEKETGEATIQQI